MCPSVRRHNCPTVFCDISSIGDDYRDSLIHHKGDADAQPGLRTAGSRRPDGQGPYPVPGSHCLTLVQEE